MNTTYAEQRERASFREHGAFQRVHESRKQAHRRLAEESEQRLEFEGKVLELRDTGLSFRAIGQRLGCSSGLVHKVYKQALERVPDEHIVEFRKRQLLRLEGLLTPFYLDAVDNGSARSARVVLSIIAEENRLMGAYAVPRPDDGTDRETPDVSTEAVIAKLNKALQQREADREAEEVLAQIERDRVALIREAEGAARNLVD